MLGHILPYIQQGKIPLNIFLIITQKTMSQDHFSNGHDHCLFFMYISRNIKD